MEYMYVCDITCKHGATSRTAVLLFYRPDGYLYDKEAILENILHQKKEST